MNSKLDQGQRQTELYPSGIGHNTGAAVQEWDYRP